MMHKLNDWHRAMVIDGLTALAEKLPHLAETADWLRVQLEDAASIAMEVYPEHDGSAPDGREGERLNDMRADRMHRD
jgi:hypothetical protein